MSPADSKRKKAKTARAAGKQPTATRSAKQSAAKSTKQSASRTRLPKPPRTFARFVEDYPAVAEAYSMLGDAVHTSGPLPEHTRALVKLAISTGARMEGAVHSHTRKALAVGATPEEIRQAVMLALPTLGLPAMMAAMSWVNDILDEPGRGKGRRR